MYSCCSSSKASCRICSWACTRDTHAMACVAPIGRSLPLPYLPGLALHPATQPHRQSRAGAHLSDLTLQAVQRGCQNQFHQLRHVLLVGANMSQHCHRVRLPAPADRAAQWSLLSTPLVCCCWVLT